MNNYCIRYAWKVNGHLYRAHTVWQGNSPQSALKDFLRRNPHVSSAHVQL